MSQFPSLRMRRLRSDKFVRCLNQETRLHPSDFIYPLFVIEGEGQKQPISSMPGQFRFSIDLLIEEAREIVDLGIPAVILFPHISADLKTPLAEAAFATDGLLQRATTALKEQLPELGVIADVALDPYTSHGHDGITDEQGQVQNDQTNAVLVRQALSLVEAGADIVAPSDMMDGRVAAIRTALEQSSYHQSKILAYSAKYASGFYGPFRDAIGSRRAGGSIDKSTYQMNPANWREALREIELDIAEGADMVMIKPGMPYLDIISRATAAFNFPIYAYQVSGEYTMLRAAIEQQWLPESCIIESLISLKRAGCQAILTYFAKEIARQPTFLC